MNMNEVPCNGCTACCRNERIILDQDEVGKYESVLTRKGHQILWMLKHKPDRSCIYLTEKGCGIHGRQPRVCREFDCRKWIEIFSDQQLNQMKTDPMDAETIEAAQARGRPTD